MFKKYSCRLFLFLLFHQIIVVSAPGDLDTSFNSTGIVVTNFSSVAGTVDEARSVVIDRNNNLIVAGTNGTDFALARYTSTGVLDATFGVGGKVITDMAGAQDIAYGVAIDSNNKIIAVGTDGANFVVARYTSAGVLDSSFGAAGDGRAVTKIGSSVTSIAYGVAIDSSNNIVVVGTDGANFIVARYLGTGVRAGQLDASFGSSVGYISTNIGSTDIAYAVAIQPDGKIVVAGSSGSDYAIARYLINGALDTILNGGSGFGNAIFIFATGYVVTNISGTDVAYAVTLQADGKIVAAGKSGANYSVARYTTEGFLDTTFNGSGKVTTNINGTDIAYGVKVQTDGKIVASGVSNNDFSAARYTTTGVLDTTFGGAGKVTANLGGTDVAYSSAITSSGKIILAGTSGSDFAIAQYTTSGVLDTAGFAANNGYVTTDIGTGSIDVGGASAMQSDGKIVVAGSSGNNIALIRYTTTGDIDRTFGVNGIVTAAIGASSVGYDIAIQTDGKIVVVGAASTSGSTPNKFVVARFTSAGILDTTFGGSNTGYIVTNVGSTSIAYGVALQSDGKIVVVGKSGNNIAVARYLSNGTLDTVANGGVGFGQTSSKKQIGYVTTNVSGGDPDIAYAVALTSAGKIVVSGVSGVNIVIAQYTSSGLLDTSIFGSGLGYVTTAIGTAAIGYSVAINSSGKIIVGGVATISTHDYFLVTQYTSAGVLDVGSFGAGVGYVTTALSSADVVYNIAIQINGYIVVAGISSGDIALSRYTDSGVLDSGFGSAGKVITAPVSGKVLGPMGLFLQPNGRIVVSATTNSFVGDFVTLRYFGDMVGMLDEKFNINGIFPGCLNLHGDLGLTQLSYGQAKQIEFSTINNVYYIAVNSGADTQITSFNGLDDTQRLNFGDSGVITIVGKTDISDLFLDATGALNVAGGFGSSGSSAGWICRYDAVHGTLISDFAPTDVLDVHTVVGQQTSARILVAGQENGLGVIIAYNSITGACDETFGINGRYLTENNAVITSMQIDSHDDIYILLNDGANTVTKKISNDGTTVLWTGDSVVSHNRIDSNSHLAFDTSGNIVIAVVDTTVQQIVIKKYSHVNGSTVATLNLARSITGFVNPVVMALIIDKNNKLLITGYDDLASDLAFIVRILPNMTGLDYTFNISDPIPGIQSYQIPVTGNVKGWNSLHINEHGRILALGFTRVENNDIPYIARFYGDLAATQNKNVLPIGVAGVIDGTFLNNGFCDLSSVSSSLVNNVTTDLLSYSDGSFCLSFDDGRNSKRLVLSKNMKPNIFVAVQDAPSGVVSMIEDGNDHVVLVGTNNIDGGWIHRYFVKGLDDNVFKQNVMRADKMEAIHVIVQQTVGRYIVGGKRGGKNVVRAYTLQGNLDTTFSSDGIVPGELLLDFEIYNLIVDQFDRLIIAYKNRSNIDIIRLTSNGHFDSTFNRSGIVSSAIERYVDNASQVKVALDIAGNIIVAAHINDGTEKIAIVSFDADGVAVHRPVYVSDLIAPVITNMMVVQNGSYFVFGYQSGNNPMWIAKITSSGELDRTFGYDNGIMKFVVSQSTQSARILKSLAVRPDGRLLLIGYEIDTNNIVKPFLTRLYNEPYQIGVEKFPKSSSAGSIDQTFGRSGKNIIHTMCILKMNEQQILDLKKREGFRSTTANGVTFFASSGADATFGQVAQAIAMQDVSTFVVAINGGASSGGDSQIFINELDSNGDFVTGFNGTGQASVSHYYQNEYVRDMVTFTTVSSVNKAIFVGYVTNTTLGKTNSVVWQYNLSSVALDGSFGGFNGAPVGVVFGYGKEAHVVGTQSNSRIIVGGLNQAGDGLLLGLTSAGKLDTSFGTNGSGMVVQGSTGIYTHAIDTLNRVVVAYNDGSNNVAVARFLADGSSLDASFGTAGLVTDKVSGISGNTNFKIAVDSNNQIVVAAVVGTTFVIKRYSSDGTTVSQGLTIAASSIGGTNGSSIYKISKLIIDVEGKVIITGYDTFSVPDNLLVLRTTANLSGLDTAVFNSPNGYITYQVSTGNSQVLTDSLLHADGRIVSVGWEN